MRRALIHLSRAVAVGVAVVAAMFGGVPVVGDAAAAAEPPSFGPPAGAEIEIELRPRGVLVVDLSWDPVADVKGYLIHRDDEFIAFLGPETTEFRESRFAAGRRLVYDVRAQRPDGTYSDPVTLTTDPAFGAPPNAKLELISSNKLGTEWRVSWTRVGDAKGYVLHVDGDYWRYVPEFGKHDPSYEHSTTLRFSNGVGPTVEIRAQRPDNTYSERVQLGAGGAPFGPPPSPRLSFDPVHPTLGFLSWGRVADVKGYLVHIDGTFVSFVNEYRLGVALDVPLGTQTIELRAQRRDNTHSQPVVVPTGR